MPEAVALSLPVTGMPGVCSGFGSQGGRTLAQALTLLQVHFTCGWLDAP